MGKEEGGLRLDVFSHDNSFLLKMVLTSVQKIAWYVNFQKMHKDI